LSAADGDRQSRLRAGGETTFHKIQSAPHGYWKPLPFKGTHDPNRVRCGPTGALEKRQHYLTFRVWVPVLSSLPAFSGKAAASVSEKQHSKYRPKIFQSQKAY
jgi:hypothetical protein